MKKVDTPRIDPRHFEKVFAELLTRRPAFTPELVPAEGEPGWALLRIFSKYMEAVIDRLNQAPDKNRLAFFDMLGVNGLATQAARAPVVFKPMADTLDGQIPARTRVGAQLPDRTEPLVFETRNTIALAAAQLVEVKTLWPARDEYSDHTTEFSGRRDFKLFESPQPVPHEIYLSHGTLFALAGDVSVEIEFDLATPGNTPLVIVWEYWDGQLWRPFDDRDTVLIRDGTHGLTRSGTLRLWTNSARAQKTKVSGIKSYWIRGRLNQPLPPDQARVLPVVDHILVRSGIERPLEFEGSVITRKVTPDHAIGDESALDLTRAFLPFGASPRQGAAFYFSCEEAFSKPGAVVNISFSKAVTREEEADGLSGDFELDVARAKISLIAAVKSAADTVFNAGKNTNDILISLGFSTLIDITQLKGLLDRLEDIDSPKSLRERIEEVYNEAVGVKNTINRKESAVSAPPTSTPIYPEELHNYLIAKAQAESAVNNLEPLSQLRTAELAAAGRDERPELSPPLLAWEYWNGQEWQTLLSPADDDARNFLAESLGTVSFTLPEDFVLKDINGISDRWVRVRIASGGFEHLRFISWYEKEIDFYNFYPVIEDRPPLLESFFLGYTYRSTKTVPENCLTSNDFRFDYPIINSRRRSGTFEPFIPVAEAMPALYLGFDRPLPRDRMSLYLDLIETERESSPLLWEFWDGTDWQALRVEDETKNLCRPGVVSFRAPIAAGRPEVAIREASGTRIRANSAADLAVFQPADQIVLRENKTEEMSLVRQVDGASIQLETPLDNTYRGGIVSRAALPRFGTPREWIRVRPKITATPFDRHIKGIYLNTVWAEQVQSIEGEVLGSSNGLPDQTFFFRQRPVLVGEQIEVRELAGARAKLEYSRLREEVLGKGHSEEDIRPVFDKRNGEISEVWVRWHGRPHFYFSGLDDRHYLIDRKGGRLIFGGRCHGRIPPAGSNNIRARRYQSGGGPAGNVPAGKITQVLSPIPFVEGVTNVRAGDGGAAGDSMRRLVTRGSHILRHRSRALSAQDYEALALQASPGVAAVRVLPQTAANGRSAPGHVTVIILPKSQEPTPLPSSALRRQVRDYLATRAPAGMCSNAISVIGPRYLAIGVAATISARDPKEENAVEKRVRQTLSTFLHPVTGGPKGRGWGFGRGVYLSDIAAVIEGLDGVDYVEELNLLLRGSPQGESVTVPADRIVMAGPIRIGLRTPESMRR